MQNDQSETTRFRDFTFSILHFAFYIIFLLPRITR